MYVRSIRTEKGKENNKHKPGVDHRFCEREYQAFAPEGRVNIEGARVWGWGQDSRSDHVKATQQ